MRVTRTKDELYNLCSDTMDVYQERFDLMLEDEFTEYDAFVKFIDLSNKLSDDLHEAVNNFEPDISSLLDLKYFSYLKLF